MPQSGQTLDCRDCVINFKSGNLISRDNGIYKFDQGGYFAVAGDLYDGNTKVSVGQQLALGTFSSSPLVIKTGGSGFSFTGGGTSKGNGAVFQYFYDKIDNPSIFGSTAISGEKTSFQSDGSFSGDVANVDLSYRLVADTASDVPEPGPLGLLGIGLALIGGALGFRRKQGRC